MRNKIVAEVASNHAGDIATAKRFINIASKTGVDYIKFQSSRYEDLVNKEDPQAEWVKKTTLSDEAHFELIEECKKYKVRFLTTCFSITRVGFLASLELDEIKVASPDLLSFSMIEKLAQNFKHLIISTGMHSKKEIKAAIDFLLKNQINSTLLHAVSLYPTPIDKVFMYKFLWLKDNFPHVGYSHHSSDIEPVKFAMAHGAEIVEAHMKLDEPGLSRIAAWDVSPDDFAVLVKYRDTLNYLLGNKKWLQKKTFLFPQEQIARKRFIGRWGHNK
jgi:N,N'-diacetyllegionaminate synthase